MPQTVSSVSVNETSALFEPDSHGYIRHWLVAGPKETPYTGAHASENILRSDALDTSRAVPPASARLGEVGPCGRYWGFYYPGRNIFVEFSDFYRQLTVIEYYAFTEILAPEDGTWRAVLWCAGACDFWVNDGHIARFTVARYHNPDCMEVLLPLKRGINRLCVRLQCLGVRDTRILFGVKLSEPRGAIIHMEHAHHAGLAVRWLDSVRGDRNRALVSSVPAPTEACVIRTGVHEAWPAGSDVFDFHGERPSAVEVEVSAGETTLRRTFEFPGNRPLPRVMDGDRRTAHLGYIAKAGENGEEPAPWNMIALPLLARRLLGRPSPTDAAAFAATLAVVDGREDCADFILAGLLRMALLHLVTPEESAEIERAALAFRYWEDEPGGDAMCFRSENHSLLFHGCQLLAGRLYPGKRFGNSGRHGDEQAALALLRIRKWLEAVEVRGFEEFNSGTYIPITIGAMLNIVDFCGDEELASRMSGQIDRIYRDLARHAFGGGIISPQGRIYRDVLFPEETGTQALLALASAEIAVDLTGARPAHGRTGDWAVFPASSPRYRPPQDLAGLIDEPVSTTYRHADVQIILEKTRAYLLTSLAVPALPRDGEHPAYDLRPGGAGYQQHLWQATLGRDCHIFVNHPGGSFDGTKSRPGYWYGNGLLPRVRQRGRVLQAIHVIADGTTTQPPITPEVWWWGRTSTVRPYHIYPIAFTHAHWPTDAFDREERRGRWVFGQKDRGLIGLWCSEPLVARDDILTGRELRATSHASAWLVICGDLNEDGPLEDFMAACEVRVPVFDRAEYTMDVKGEETLRWWERSEPMPS